MNSLKTFFRLVPLFLVAIACQYSNPAADSDVASISVGLNLPDPDDRRERTQSTPLPKTLIVDRVTLRVRGAGMDEIVQDLDLNSARTRASGTVEVPKGDNRIFTVFVRDENDILQYVGRDTTDIQGDNEAVNITTAGIYPAAVSLNVTRVGVLSVDLDWTRSSEDDFDRYEVVRSNSSDLSPGNRISLRTILNENNTDFTDLTTVGGNDYYYAVIVWDTEGMGLRSEPVGIRTGQFNELIYDDGNPTGGFFWAGLDQGSANRLTALTQVKVVIARYYIRNVIQGGTFRALVFTLDNNSIPVTLASKEVTAPGSGWFNVDFSEDDIFVNGDFYVMMQYNGVAQPRFGYNSTDNGRAWDYDGTSWSRWAGTYLMRAIVEQEGGLLKELAPAGQEDNPVVSAPRGQLPSTGSAPPLKVGFKDKLSSGPR